jgi:hypothetical protein
VRYSGDSDLALSKKRARKLSDDEVYNLVDVGNIPKVITNYLSSNIFFCLEIPPKPRYIFFTNICPIPEIYI